MLSCAQMSLICTHQTLDIATKKNVFTWVVFSLLHFKGSFSSFIIGWSGKYSHFGQQPRSQELLGTRLYASSAKTERAELEAHKRGLWEGEKYVRKEEKEEAASSISIFSIPRPRCPQFIISGTRLLPPTSGTRSTTGKDISHSRYDIQMSNLTREK